MKSKSRFVRLIAIPILLSVLILSSCGASYGYGHPYPGDYMGIYISIGSGQQTYYAETYEEVMWNIGRMQEYGSTLIKSALITYDSWMFDTKYAFFMSRKNCDKEILWGDSPYERKVEKADVMSYIFFEDVDLDKLYFSSIYQYKVFELARTIDSLNIPSIEEIKSEDITYLWNEERSRYDIYFGETVIYYLNAIGTMKTIPDEIMQEIFNSIVYVELNG